MSLKSVFFTDDDNDNPCLAEKVESNIKYLKSLAPYGLTSNELLAELDRLQAAAKKIKTEGISMWNAKQQSTKAFDLIDGAFVILREIIKNQGEKE